MPAPDIAYNNIIIFITSHPHLLQLLSINSWICWSLTFSEPEPTSPSLFTKDLLRSGHYLPPVRSCRLPNEDIVEGGSSSNHRDLIKREQDGIVDRRMSWKFKNILFSTDKSEPSQQFPFEWADLAPHIFWPSLIFWIWCAGKLLDSPEPTLGSEDILHWNNGPEGAAHHHNPISSDEPLPKGVWESKDEEECVGLGFWFNGSGYWFYQTCYSFSPAKTFHFECEWEITCV